MKVGDRITMLRYDGWASRGWTGTVNTIRAGAQSISVKWDNGKHLAHKAKDIRILDSENNPNEAFRMHKFDKEKKK